MSENGTMAATEETASPAAETTSQETDQAGAQNTEDIAYHTVEKEGNVTAIWEMQGRRHIRTIDPRSNEGKQILELFETAG
ncbi:MAG: hypothetical protein AVDCRST_MAG74-1332 [uncultured Pyrinomonadaceae bacterium]|uniref:Uncharacterized protein n=1 Tax=uncultured Pyrinomonadaceae bacterium TaxID=2283094 RepID=A0A6J4N6G1_9BACT|nr:MAG: hypothetical protein AVDCRST_MAG74-1332 [uncultured Pyrinomonadaceae bacterium]